MIECRHALVWVYDMFKNTWSKDLCTCKKCKGVFVLDEQTLAEIKARPESRQY